MVTITGPKFRSAKINPNRKLGFKANRQLPFGKRRVKFRKQGVTFRKEKIKFRTGSISNIDIEKNEDPIVMNNLGVKYYNKGKYKIALNYFDKAIAIAPQFEDAKRNRVYCIQMMRQKKAESRAAYSSKNLNYDYKQAQQIPQKPAVEVHPLDYNATRFSAHHQFGRIPSRDEHAGSSYNDYYGREYYRR